MLSIVPRALPKPLIDETYVLHVQMQCDDRNGMCSNSSMLDIPSSPSSVTTPGSPSIPSSLYSNPYTYSATSSSKQTMPPSNRGSMQHVGSPASPMHSPYYGRPIRGSPSYR